MVNSPSKLLGVLEVPVAACGRARRAVVSSFELPFPTSLTSVLAPGPVSTLFLLALAMAERS